MIYKEKNLFYNENGNDVIMIFYMKKWYKNYLKLLRKV